MMFDYSSPLLTDLYQLTMMQGYFEQGMDDTAVFEFFVRKLPDNRSFLLAAGLEQTLHYLEDLHWSENDLSWLEESGRFSKPFVDWLAGMRFTGEVHAMPEGTVFFANEPIVRITASLPQAQLVESRVINLLHYQTLIASKAARCRLCAPDKLLVDFGLRRAHGAEAGLFAARASYIAGFNGSATVLAGQRFDIPAYGTMAHSFIQAHDDEVSAFEHFAHAQPRNVVLLIDTYDTEQAAHDLVALAPRLKAQDIAIQAVRIDSGDLGDHARRVRDILDDGGLSEIGIFASGNVDEYLLEQLVAGGAPIGGFGIGTHMDTSADAPYLDCAYKLQEYAGRARRKRSEGKATWPGRKQVYRQLDDAGRIVHDVVTLVDDPCDGMPLLEPVMSHGELIAPWPTLESIAETARRNLDSLPAESRRLRGQFPRPVHISNALQALAASADRAAGH